MAIKPHVSSLLLLFEGFLAVWEKRCIQKEFRPALVLKCCSLRLQLTGQSVTFTELFLSHSCVTLALQKIIVTLEGEPLAQSEVLSPVEQVSMGKIFALCSIHLSLKPDQFASPCCLTPPPPTAWCCYQHASQLKWHVDLRPSLILASSYQRILFITV